MVARHRSSRPRSLVLAQLRSVPAVCQRCSWSLTTVTLLDFYFSQFEAIVGALVQFALLMGVILYRRRYVASESDSDLPFRRR